MRRKRRWTEEDDQYIENMTKALAAELDIPMSTLRYRMRLTPLDPNDPNDQQIKQLVTTICGRLSCSVNQIQDRMRVIKEKGYCPRTVDVESLEPIIRASIISRPLWFEEDGIEKKLRARR